MAGRRSTHTFRPMGNLELKGLAEPVATLEVGWEPLADEDGALTEVRSAVEALSILA